MDYEQLECPRCDNTTFTVNRFTLIAECKLCGIEYNLLSGKVVMKKERTPKAQKLCDMPDRELYELLLLKWKKKKKEQEKLANTKTSN